LHVGEARILCDLLDQIAFVHNVSTN